MDLFVDYLNSYDKFNRKQKIGDGAVVNSKDINDFCTKYSVQKSNVFVLSNFEIWSFKSEEDLFSVDYEFQFTKYSSYWIKIKLLGSDEDNLYQKLTLPDWFSSNTPVDIDSWKKAKRGSDYE